MKKVRIDITNVHRDDVTALVTFIQGLGLSCFKRDEKKDHRMLTFYDVKVDDWGVEKTLRDHLADECWSWEVENLIVEDTETHTNGTVLRLPSISTDKVEMEVIECSCGYHMGIDSSFLEGVGDFKTICPSCQREINTEIDVPETVKDIQKLVDAENCKEKSETVTVNRSVLSQLVDYSYDQEKDSCDEYIQDGGHEDDHIFSIIKHLKEEVEK